MYVTFFLLLAQGAGNYAWNMRLSGDPAGRRFGWTSVPPRLTFK
jgi:hypothetical protein